MPSQAFPCLPSFEHAFPCVVVTKDVFPCLLYLTATEPRSPRFATRLRDRRAVSSTPVAKPPSPRKGRRRNGIPPLLLPEEPAQEHGFVLRARLASELRGFAPSPLPPACVAPCRAAQQPGQWGTHGVKPAHSCRIPGSSAAALSVAGPPPPPQALCDDHGPHKAPQGDSVREHGIGRLAACALVLVRAEAQPQRAPPPPWRST